MKKTTFVCVGLVCVAAGLPAQAEQVDSIASRGPGKLVNVDAQTDASTTGGR